MKNLLYRLTVILLVGFVFIGCSHKDDPKEETETATIDFGSGTYRPTPFNLDNVIPFSWLGMPDSVKKEAEFVISFNDDAVRSQSKGNIYLVDSNGNRVNGIHIGSLQGEEVAISAGKKEITLPLTYLVNPEVGDSLLKGYVMVVGDKLDEVNNTQLIASATPIGDWQLKHKIGINWWRWLLLILIVVLILAVLFLIGYGTWEASKAIAGNIPTFTMPKFNRNKTKKDKKKKKCPCEEIKKEILGWEEELYSHITVADKYDVLEKIRMKFDELYKYNQECYVECKKALKDKTWDALEYAWTYWKQFPNKNVIWLIDNKMCQLTIDHKHYDECKKRSFITCLYDEHGSPNFDNVTVPGSIVNISDLYDNLSQLNIKGRGRGKNSLQVIGQERMMESLEPLINEWAKENNCEADFWKWRDAHKLVPHEDTNCRTMRLVYRPVHEAFLHRGGVANAINIKSHFES